MDVFKIHSWRSAASGSFQVVAIRDEDQDFEEALQVWMGKDRYDWTVGVRISDDTMHTAVRLAVGTCLLATGADQILERDVLVRHQERYHKSTDPEERTNLAEKARRSGKYGWTLGREISLPTLYGCSETQTPTGVHGSLKHSHLRRGHFHRVRPAGGAEIRDIRSWPSHKSLRR